LLVVVVVVQVVLDKIDSLLLKEQQVVLVELVCQLGQHGVPQLHLAKIFLERIGLQEEAVHHLPKVVEVLEEAVVEEQVVPLMALQIVQEL
jgi:hypothetical protein